MGSKHASKEDVLAAIQAAQTLARDYMQSGQSTQDGRLELSTAAVDLTNACQTTNDIASRLTMENACPPAALRVAIEAGWTDVLKEKKSVTANELVEICGGEKNLVVRIMRVLTASRIVRQAGFQEYATTELLMTLLQPGMKDLSMHCTDEVNAVLAKLPFHLSNTSFAEPCEQGTGPYAYTFGRPVWKRAQEEPMLNERFNRAMTVSHIIRGIPAECFPFDVEAAEMMLTADEVLLVDIGGGMGHLTLRIKNMYPSIIGRLIVQDLPHVVEHAKTKTELTGSGIEFQGHDMFKPQPVQSAAFYFLSAVMHNWTDGPCLAILRHVRKAMKKGYSRLLISDFVLPDTGATLASASLALLMMVNARRLQALIDRQHGSSSGLIWSEWCRREFRRVNMANYEDGRDCLDRRICSLP